MLPVTLATLDTAAGVTVSMVLFFGGVLGVLLRNRQATGFAPVIDNPLGNAAALLNR